MFQNRCPFLYNSSAFLLSFFCIAQSHCLDFVLSWNFITKTIFTFLWPDSIFIIQKENGNGDKVIYFVLNHVILIRKCFFTSAYFSPFDLKSLLNQKLSSLKAKFCFCDWQINVLIFQMLLGYNIPRISKECKKNMNGDKINLLLTHKWEENIPKLYFCIRAPTFSKHML